MNSKSDEVYSLTDTMSQELRVNSRRDYDTWFMDKWTCKRRQRDRVILRTGKYANQGYAERMVAIKERLKKKLEAKQ